MIRAAFSHPLSVFLIIILAAPSGFAQNPPTALPPAQAQAPAAPPPAAPPVPLQPGGALKIVILEGNKAINSIPLLSSVAATVEIRDPNDYPVEDASVTFTLPEHGPGGTFLQGGKTFSTRSNARGQAMAPAVAPAGMGKFQITVSATANGRKGQTVVNQTNTAGSYVGPTIPPPVWYMRKKLWIITGVAITAIVLVAVLHKGAAKTVDVTPGTPVFGQ